jgi:serine/threonine-protein kinase
MLPDDLASMRAPAPERQTAWSLPLTTGLAPGDIHRSEACPLRRAEGEVVTAQGLRDAGIREGDVLAGKYCVERVLGQGGMGVVVAARHIQLDERVALKFLLPHALSSREAVGRFIREARAAVKIKCEHVARVSDVGELENGAPYMVMEYLEGRDLAAWLQQRGPLSIEQAAEFVLQACVAVADAHALGIVHRDLKPANLFCVRRSDGQMAIKVLDFGISKMTSFADGESGSMTATSAMMGTPLYMSPEQMRSSKDVDARTDIWALGAILYELLSGRPVFQAQSVTELAIKVASEPPTPVTAFRPDVPPGLQAAIGKCLEKRREDRYSNVGQLSIDLLPFAPRRAKASVERISGIIQAAGLSASALAVPASADATLPSGGAAGATMRGVGRTTLGVSRGRAATIGGAVAAVVLAAGATLAVVARQSPGTKSDSHTATTAGQPPSVAAAPVAAAVTAASASGESAHTSVVVAAPPSATASSHLADPPRPDPAQPSIAAGKPVVRAPAVAPGHAATTPAAAPTVVPAAAPPASKAAVNCDPPSFIDARGNRAFKPECL